MKCAPVAQPMVRSNAFFKAINGGVQRAKRAARSFRTATYIIAISYFRSDKLTHLPTSPFVRAPTRVDAQSKK
jgi:hypothetical protein